METVAKLMEGEPIPVAVVADQQDIAQAKHKNANTTCKDCGEMPCKCGAGRRASGLMPNYEED